jgi:choice-of-anchor C domain-containing protein
MPGWTVLPSNVDWINFVGNVVASNGTWFLDLNGSQTGGIQQTFDTTPGTVYAVTFDLNDNNGDNNLTPRSVQVSAASVVQVFTYTPTVIWGPWITQSFTFTATATETTLTFHSLVPNSDFGPLLDNVTVTAEAPAEWIQTEPSGRASTSAVYVPAKNQMIIFGGYDATSKDYNDVWRLNVANGVSSSSVKPFWSQVAPHGVKPAPRSGASAVYDPGSDRMIVYGGGLGQASPCTSQVWVLENASGAGGTPTWSQLSPSGTQPAPRLRHSAIYDPISNRMVVFGGNNCFSNEFSDTWVLSNANGLGGTPVWTELAPSTLPPAREDFSATYDPTSNVMTILGGVSQTAVLGDVWTLAGANGLAGPPVWTLLSPSGPTIPPRDTQTAVYDPGSNRMIVFGGQTSSGVLLNDVWVLQFANGQGGTPTWSQLGPFSPSPVPVSFPVSVYDPVSNRMTVFGGSASTDDYLDTFWILANANGQ